jgi:ubiquinone/menaquinone biosynthesis C-methylase UbiE
MNNKRREPASNIEWQSWGKLDPLYGVASLEGRNKRGKNPWTDEEFYAYGALVWSEYIVHWERYGVNRESCVEIGCGAGRMTKQLSAYFKRVHAVDVSRDMIEYARAQVDSDKVSFHVTDGCVLPVVDNSVSAGFSTDVFQHFEQPSFAEEYFSELFRVLMPGGSIMIHLPVYSWPHVMRPIFSGLYRMWRAADMLQARMRRVLLRRGFGNPFMYGIKYETTELYKFLYGLGFRDIEINFFENTGDSGFDFRSYLFARKSLQLDHGGPQEAQSTT